MARFTLVILELRGCQGAPQVYKFGLLRRSYYDH